MEPLFGHYKWSSRTKLVIIVCCIAVVWFNTSLSNLIIAPTKLEYSAMLNLLDSQTTAAPTTTQNNNAYEPVDRFAEPNANANKTRPSLAMDNNTRNEGVHESMLNQSKDIKLPDWLELLPKAAKTMKIYVYTEGKLTNWIKLLDDHTCRMDAESTRELNPPTPNHDKSNLLNMYQYRIHSDDYHFARVVTSSAFTQSRWYTSDPEEADLFVVPLLLNLFFGEDYVLCDGNLTKEAISNQTMKYLESFPHFEETKHRHFLVHGHWRTSRLKRYPTVFHNFFLSSNRATFEYWNLDDIKCTIPSVYIPYPCHYSNLQQLEVQRNEMQLLVNGSHPKLTNISPHFSLWKDGMACYDQKQSSKLPTNATIPCKSEYELHGVPDNPFGTTHVEDLSRCGAVSNAQWMFGDSCNQLQKTRPIDIWFRGRIDRRKAYSSRLKACRAASQVAVQSQTRNTVCVSTSRYNNKFQAHRTAFRTSCQPENITTGCTVHDKLKSKFSYCGELQSAKFGLMLAGDTATSARVYEAIVSGVIPVLVYDDDTYDRFIQSTPQHIPWHTLLLKCNSKNGYAACLSKLNRIHPSVLGPIYRNLNQYSKIVDFWNEGGLPTALLLMANAIEICL